jgi:hypothetical protein
MSFVIWHFFRSNFIISDCVLRASKSSKKELSRQNGVLALEEDDATIFFKEKYNFGLIFPLFEPPPPPPYF